ncbi:MAG: MarR family transcriptional regulator [Oscillospiraceae bacterium]|nr:MarR family transcriptional regulator [Oscillospiraceae bacterium]MBQ3880365.1 MarR family transcriptional regulator [Oscillospiraceae bacterium]
MEGDNHIGFHLRTVSVLTRRFRDQLADRDCVEQLTGMQGWVVGYIYDHRDRDIFQRDLESVFSVRRSTMTNMLKLLEKNGFITRESVEHDARLKKILLTPKAILNHEHVIANLKTTEEKLCEGLTQEEIETFLRIIRKIERNLDSENPKDGGNL